MAELINRLKVDKFTSEELMYLSGNYEIEMQLVQTQEEKRRVEERETKLQNELKTEREQRQAEREKGEIEVKAEREKRHADLLKGIKKLLNRGETIDGIADFYELPVEEITAFVKQIEDKNREETDLKRNHI
jgi:ABC-type phosphate transport system auxiliary subunit